MAPKKQSAIRVQDVLRERGFAFEVLELPSSTRTAQEAADTIGCNVAQIAKSLIFKDANSGEPILIIASGSNRVCTAKFEEFTGIKLAKADGKFVKHKVGFAIGGVPPVGHLCELKTYLDLDLKQFEIVWAAAGTPFAVFQLKSRDLSRLTAGEWLPLAEE